MRISTLAIMFLSLGPYNGNALCTSIPKSIFTPSTRITKTSLGMAGFGGGGATATKSKGGKTNKKNKKNKNKSIQKPFDASAALIRSEKLYDEMCV